jgi:glycerol-3-phosphate dehydrogenase (NAD(P)+)
MTGSVFAVWGAGAWGTALSLQLSRNDHEVHLFTHHEDTLQYIKKNQHHPYAFTDIKLPKNIVMQNFSQWENSEKYRAVYLVSSAQNIRTNLSPYAKTFAHQTPIIIASKGIERESGLLLSEVITQILENPTLAILSGPNFADEVARNLPTITSIACASEIIGREIIADLASHYFRPYWTGDLIGAQILGAAKNVLAIACGIARGRNLGENAVAALITRGLFELQILLGALGGHADTINAPCGVGDVILTCTSQTSRNMKFGFKVGQGEVPQNYVLGKTTEGIATAAAICCIAAKLQLDLPIAQSVHNILSGKQSIEEAIKKLLARPV